MKTIRVGNGCGFWGDNLDAPVLLARDGRLDYLTLEYLAELTMSILALQKQRDPQAGFAGDFLDVLERLTPILRDQPSLKVVTNAGGMNATACAAKARAILDQAGLQDRKIATVAGDDLMPKLDALMADGEQLTNLDTGQPLAAVRDRVVSANAYLGAQPIAETLRLGASIIISGRVADASLTVGPAAHAFGWKWDDWDRLAAASVAGHIIECGAQASGGLWCNWPEARDLANVGYPIAEIAANGDLSISKPPNTGGAVNLETISEQLLYEVGDPAAYLTPDVVADFTSVKLSQGGEDVVLIAEVRGKPATDTYKVSIAYRDGFSASGTLVLVGPDAARKARQCGQMLLQRLQRAGFTPERSNVEVLGAGDAVPGVLGSSLNPRLATLRRSVSELTSSSGATLLRSVAKRGSDMFDPPEVVLRVSVHDGQRAVVERFSKEFAPLVTSGPPGVTGYTTGRPPVREVFAYWPALISKKCLRATVLFQ